MRKAQLSLEFILAVGFILIFGMLIMLYGFDKQRDISLSDEYLDLKDECLKMANLAHSAFVLGDGSQFSSASEYNATFFHRTIKIVKDDETDFTCISPVYFPSALHNNGASLSIKNQGGSIIIE